MGEYLRYLGIASLITILTLSLITVPQPAFSEGLRTYQVMRFATLRVPAVYIEGGVTHGVATELQAGIAYPGHGTVYFSAEPLTQIDMQAATRVAAMVASTYAGVPLSNYDFFVRIRSNSEMVGGPSASGATTVALLALLTGARLKSNVSMTGMIEPDGTVGPVGGVPEKLEAMAKVGVKVFLIPKGQAVVKGMRRIVENRTVGNTVIISERIVPVTINVTKLGEKLGVKVIEVGSVAEAYKYFTGRELKLPKPTLKYPTWLLNELKEIANYMLNQAKSNVTAVEGKVTSGPLKDLLKEVEDHMRRCEEYLSEGRYYSAASEAFISAILASYLNQLVKASEEVTTQGIIKVLRDGVRKYLRAAEDVLKEVNGLLSNLRSKGYTDVSIQLAIASYIRLQDANESIKEAEQARLYPISIGNDALYYAVYSYWRARTALDYARLATNLSTYGKALSSNLLARGVNTLLHFAVSVDAYLSSLGGKGYGVDLGKAMELISRGEYVEAAAYAVNALTYDVAAMHAYYGTQKELAPYAREGAEVLIGRAQEFGLTPILPILYLERAETINDSLARIRLYEYASAYSLLLINSIKQPVTPPKGAAPLTTTVFRTSTVTKTNTETTTSVSTITITKSSITTSTITATVTTTKTTTKVKLVPMQTLTTATIASLLILLFIAGLIIGIVIGRALHGR